MRYQQRRRSKLLLLSGYTPVPYSQKDEHAKTGSLKKVVLTIPLLFNFLYSSPPTPPVSAS